MDLDWLKEDAKRFAAQKQAKDQAAKYADELNSLIQSEGPNFWRDVIARLQEATEVFNADSGGATLSVDSGSRNDSLNGKSFTVRHATLTMVGGPIAAELHFQSAVDTVTVSGYGHPTPSKYEFLIDKPGVLRVFAEESLSAAAMVDHELKALLGAVIERF
jgi:hypothetical protein